MERWSGKVAVVTGASAGIGAAIAIELARKGMKVAGLARRADKVQELSAALDGATGQLHAVACDLTKEEDILAAFDWVIGNLGGVDVLVNNAGVLNISPLSSAESDSWRQMLDVNVIALNICTREALKSMKTRKADGHIIHINSVAGHIMVPGPFSMYCATKHAVTVLTEGLRMELVSSGSKVKVTSVSPGVVITDMVTKHGSALGLQPEDLAASVVFALSTPPHVQIQELTLRGVPEKVPWSPPGAQPDFPLEYQRGAPPESPPQVTREAPPEPVRAAPPENPPEPEPEKQPEIPPEAARAAPPEPEPEPEKQPEIPPEAARAAPPEAEPEKQPENPPEAARVALPENPSEPEPEKQPENPPDQPREAPQEELPEHKPEDQPEKPPHEPTPEP